MTVITDVNLKVLVMDPDFYSLHSINSFLAWDRRTRVTNLSESLEEMWHYIDHTPLAELPDVVLLEADHGGGVEQLYDTITHLNEVIPSVRVLCLGQDPLPDLVDTAARAQASGYFLKQEVRLQIAWAVVYAMDYDFVVTPGISRACQMLSNRRVFKAALLPEQRKFPELTHRIRQAMKLCVLDGLPAQLAADEMGISLHTIRGYVKEGYRILESYDETEYPVEMTPQERAFMRLTAFENNLPDAGDLPVLG
ncbi:MAG: response regulator transcription factor [Anaerolineaceae bacterium]|nr:response regulator transcription factor [Anaerolineaceae bacterium]